MATNTRLTIPEILYLKKLMEEQKYAKDGNQDMRKNLTEKLDNIIKLKVTKPR